MTDIPPPNDRDDDNPDEAPKGARGFRGRAAWRRAGDEARSVAGDEEASISLLSKAWRKIHDTEITQHFAAIMDDLEAAIRMVTMRVRGTYPGLPLERVILLLAGLVYLISPVDAIPDVIPVVGYVDDVAVLSWILGKLSEEIDVFKEWEAANGGDDFDGFDGGGGAVVLASEAANGPEDSDDGDSGAVVPE